MGQRIYLDKENRLVIETNNGKQDINGTTTMVKGDFSVSAEDVVKLFAFVNKKDVVFPYCHFEDTIWGCYSKWKSIIIAHDECVMKAVEEASQIIKEKDDKIAEIEQEYNKDIREKNEEIIRLRKEIERYNNSRKWYERKINID